MPPSLAADDLDRLKGRIAALLAKTVGNGCTEEEALAAAAKAAELMDRHDLSLSDADLGRSPCEQLAYRTMRKKRMPIEDCVGAVAAFCDCRVWREKDTDGAFRTVFFGLRSDVTVAHTLTAVIDEALRSELGRYKTSRAYQRFRHQERSVANTSFSLGMAASVAAKLDTLKRERDQANRATGRDIVLVKSNVVDTELAKLDLALQTRHPRSRTVSVAAYEAGGVAGTALALDPGTRKNLSGVGG